MKSLITIAISLAALTGTAYAQPVTCVGPGPCPDWGYEIQHVKHIECGPFADLPKEFVFSAEVPLNIIPLAGQAGVPQSDQCLDLRRALLGD